MPRGVLVIYKIFVHALLTKFLYLFFASEERKLVQLLDEVLGYWPSSIFSYLASSAAKIDRGGEVYSSESTGHHKKTQMGIGHSGNEGFGKACYIRNIGYMDNSGKFKDVKAQSLNLFATRPFCYNVEISNIKHGSFGTHIYFGVLPRGVHSAVRCGFGSFLALYFAVRFN